MNATTAKHALTCIACGSHDVSPRVREAAACNSCGKSQMLYEAKACDCDGYDCVLPDPGPVPGIEYPFSVSDIAHATAARLAAELGDEWTAEAGWWGITGTISGPYIATFTIEIDYEGDLRISYSQYEDDDFPRDPELPEDVRDCEGGVYLMHACAPDGLDNLSERSAAAIRAVIGR
ncbi:hypothetical protein [Streptomyces zaomyceticus]|uniref:hypothetical protein n=1 Tax=Streptomyces zaomyceticus TaxID=68286 RepID=UPI002E1A496A